jgi:hypothetical protein
MHTGEEQQLEIGKRKKKCHGNRKLQHFKRKCRARGLNEEEITVLIQNRNHTISEQSSNDQMVIEQTHESNKRKRDLSTQPFIISSIKSMSQLSISQGVSKKLKCSSEETNSSKRDRLSQSNQDNLVLYKPSKYLKMPRRLLLHSLRLQLKCSLKKKKEQNFILSRLKIIDQQFCIDQIRYLYQTYFDLGLLYQVWPVSF